jgi:1-acyl-sn-glycerol-3-phosphate acyltransferase
MQKTTAPWEVLWSAGVWLIIGALTILFSVAILIGALVLRPFDRKRALLHGLAALWGQAIFLCNPFWRVTVTGRKQIKPRTPYILVANHQSFLDIMALFCLRRQFKWMAKEELFAIPFLGWAMSAAGYIKLSRGRASSIHEAYRQAGEWVESGMSVFFFPEGTRSVSGELGPFKNGAFKLALDWHVCVVPIVITGTRDLLPRGRWRLGRKAHVRISVLPPMDPSPYRHTGASRFRDDARQAIQHVLENRRAT